jgi:hypothetical protein
MHICKEINDEVLMLVMLFKEIMLLSLVHEFRESDFSLHNLKGVDLCATCEGISFKKFKGAELKSSVMRCHITYRSITFMYTFQYTVLTNSHRLCCMSSFHIHVYFSIHSSITFTHTFCYMKSYHIHVYFSIHSSITFTQTVLYVVLSLSHLNRH